MWLDKKKVCAFTIGYFTSSLVTYRCSTVIFIQVCLAQIIYGVFKMRCLLSTEQVWHEEQNKTWTVRITTFSCTSVWKRLGFSSTMPGKLTHSLHIQSHIYPVLASVDHLLLCHLFRFTAAGVHSAAHLSALTMEDYPTLGISSMEDRTQLFRLVQMLKSLDLWCDAHDSECNSSDSDENCRVVDDGLPRRCLCPDGDVYDLSGVGKCLNFSGKTFSHHHKESCYPSHVHISARHNRSAEAGQRKEAAKPLQAQFVSGFLELMESNSGISHRNHRGRNTKTDTQGNSTYRPPHVLSHKLMADTVPSMQPSNGQVWHKERKGISKKEKPCMEKSRRKALEQEAVTMPVYESRTAGYNYGLPLSSPPAPNKR